MARILIIGGGFGGVVAAESLAERLGLEHQITLVSRHREFTFFPALVRLAFGHIAVEDVFYDLEQAMLSRRITFLQAEIVALDPRAQLVTGLQGAREIQLPYDYLIFALGRRLAIEKIPGFMAHAHHLLTVDAALRFREAIKDFHSGHAVIGYCPESRLPTPVYETAFALDRAMRERNLRDQVSISIISPESVGGSLCGVVAPQLQSALEKHGIEFIPNFAADFITPKHIRGTDSRAIPYDLLMLVPPFQGLYETEFSIITDRKKYICVDAHMRSPHIEGLYAVGDAVNFPGPKMAHMAALQGAVAAANIVAEIDGRKPETQYDHQIMMVIDAGGKDSIHLRHKFWEDGDATIRQGRFWGWAKQIHEKYWTKLHSLKLVE